MFRRSPNLANPQFHRPSRFLLQVTPLTAAEQILPTTDDFPAKDAARHVFNSLGMNEADRPSIGVILGSGLGPAADRLLSSGGAAISYGEIPQMPRPHVAGHAGRLVIGQILGVSVAMLQGRVHYYEGHSPSAIVYGTRLLCHLGVKSLIVTNAAGGIRKGFSPGDLMIINSHLRPLAASGLNIGTMIEDERCEAAAHRRQCLWSHGLQRNALSVTTSLNVHQGVYAMMTGPTYETPSEIRMLQKLGADAVGMSTVPEAIFAASRGINVLGVSCITNVAAGLSEKTLNHSEVTETASSIETEFVNWLWGVIQGIATNHD